MALCGDGDDDGAAMEMKVEMGATTGPGAWREDDVANRYRGDEC